MRTVALAAVLVVFLAVPVSADWVKLEDFEGDLSNWNGGLGNLNGGIGADPDDYTNSVLFSGTSPSPDTNFYLALGDDNIATGAIGTLFGRMRTNDTMETLNGHFGVSASSSPTAWGDFSAYITADDRGSAYPGAWRVRDGTAYEDTDQQPDNQTWVNFWIVVDNPKDYYHVYYTTTYGESADSGDQMTHSGTVDNFIFRGGTGAKAMQTLLVRAAASNAKGWYLDDLYIDSSSQNLSNPVAGIPEPGTMLLVGTGVLGVLGYVRRRRMS